MAPYQMALRLTCYLRLHQLDDLVSIPNLRAPLRKSCSHELLFHPNLAHICHHRQLEFTATPLHNHSAGMIAHCPDDPQSLSSLANPKDLLLHPNPCQYLSTAAPISTSRA